MRKYIKLTAEQIIGILILLLGVWLFLIAGRFPGGADIFPKFVLVCMMLLAAVLFSSSFFGKRAEAEQRLRDTIRPFAKPLIIFLLCVVYSSLVAIIGYFIATGLFAVGMMFYLGVRRPSLIICSILALLTLVYLLFIVTLDVPIPRGLLF